MQEKEKSTHKINRMQKQNDKNQHVNRNIRVTIYENNGGKEGGRARQSEVTQL